LKSFFADPKFKTIAIDEIGTGTEVIEACKKRGLINVTVNFEPRTKEGFFQIVGNPPEPAREDFTEIMTQRDLMQQNFFEGIDYHYFFNKYFYQILDIYGE
jgi:hypothetical protein